MGRARFVLLSLALGACGARTELAPGAVVDGGEIDAPVEHFDAARDVGADVEDVGIPRGCPVGTATRVYVITSQNGLYSFDPPSLTFDKVGDIACPGARTAPWSMAVARDGTAYSVFDDGTFWKIDTATARCEPTPFLPDQQGFLTFGMGYAGDATSDTLYVAQADFSLTSRGLATIDTDSYRLAVIGRFQPPLTRCELTGTSDRRLFAFCLNSVGSTLSEVDPATARVLGSSTLVIGEQMDAFAFAFWGGDFWIFTGNIGITTVTRYDPRSQTERDVTTFDQTIVGAGVSTCAPR